MAKRKRKMTLFDVINSGQPIGVQVRQRVPTYQPTPELPIKKKLAKLFGRKPRDGRDPNQPLSAAEELELLRRELGGKPAAREETKTTQEAVPRSHRERLETQSPSHRRAEGVVHGEEVADDAEEVETFEAEPVARHSEPFVPDHVHFPEEEVEEESSARDLDPTARFFAARESQRDPREAIRTPREPARSSRRVAEVAKELCETPPAPPHKPRKPMRVVMRDVWAAMSPQVERARAAIERVAQQMALSAWTTGQASLESLRNINTRHAATLATAVSGIIVLGGAFYVGKLLLQRPPTDAALVDANGINTTPRPEVMDVDANQAVANVSRSVPNVSLEKSPAQPAQQKPTALASNIFGGRNLDLNYVIVQSYYTQAEADAAVDVLAKYGIRTTVEKNLPGWRSGDKDFFSVVSADGYAKMKDNAVYQAFLVTVAKISDRETGSTLPKRLDPRPYKYVRSVQ